jgi:hypothetical protein
MRDIIFIANDMVARNTYLAASITVHHDLRMFVGIAIDKAMQGGSLAVAPL